MKRIGKIMNDKIEFLGAKEIAKICGCPVVTARQLMLRYDFPLIRVGRAMKVEKNAFKEWAGKRRI